jgi:3-oxoacyl-[acyl-carrier-protein] synthase III
MHLHLICRLHAAAFCILMETAANFIRSGRYKKVIIVGGDKMSSMVDYSDRSTCPIFGDGAAAFLWWSLQLKIMVLWIQFVAHGW